MTRIWTALIVLLLVSVAVLAQDAAPNGQDDAQFCVRAYEDRNANGQRDSGELTLQGGISAELAHASGVVIASALLMESPTAAQGVICFQNLAPGQYTITVASAAYRATTPATLTATLANGALPTVLEFGAQALAAAATVEEVAELPLELGVERVLVSLLGTIAAVFVMLLLGIFVFLLFVRPRVRRAARAYAASQQGMYQRPPDETGPYYPR